MTVHFVYSRERNGLGLCCIVYCMSARGTEALWGRSTMKLRFDRWRNSTQACVLQYNCADCLSCLHILNLYIDIQQPIWIYIYRLLYILGEVNILVGILWKVPYGVATPLQGELPAGLLGAGTSQHVTRNPTISMWNSICHWFCLIFNFIGTYRSRPDK